MGVMLLKRKLTSFQIIILGFSGVILFGTFLLMLPFSSRSGLATPFFEALFTSTSAVCVTGLIIHDTATYWSVFGQIVILLLIQIGGLGFMSVAAIASFVLRRTITLHERMVMSAGLNLSDGGGIVRLTRRVLFGTFIIEGAGAILLSCRFVPHYGFPKGITMGVFHAVSAFCNAGFDLMGTPDDPFQSLIGWAEDPLVNITVMALIVLGGLGFFVWSDVWDKHSFRRLRLHTKIVLTATAGLLLFGFGWARPVPVNIANFRNRRWGMALTALAGPVSNFITAFIAYCLYFVVRMNMANTFLWSLSQFLLIVASMSVGLGVFNLVPVHPLDGSRVVDAFMPFSWSLKLQKYQNIIFFVFIVALWFGWLDGIMDWVGNGVLMLAVNFVSLFL